MLHVFPSDTIYDISDSLNYISWLYNPMINAWSKHCSNGLIRTPIRLKMQQLMCWKLFKMTNQTQPSPQSLQNENSVSRSSHEDVMKYGIEIKRRQHWVAGFCSNSCGGFFIWWVCSKDLWKAGVISCDAWALLRMLGWFVADIIKVIQQWDRLHLISNSWGETTARAGGTALTLL